MQRPNRIPLFPLDVVLLPTMPLPLHIFEPRYKSMIRRCLDEKIEFGMILAAEKAVATVGCTAEIVRKVRDYADGRSDILAEGRAVFHLGQLLDEKEYYEGRVDYLADEPSALDAEKESQLVGLFEQCHAHLFGRPWSDAGRNEPATLAYRMAALLPIERMQKQALLENRSEASRRDFVVGWMNAFLPRLAERQRTRHRAGSNGHASN
jgi:Lon protease-like protein